MTTATLTRPPRPAPDAPELVALRVLWHSLHPPGCDPPGAPGIAYDRPVVQTSPATPTTPHGFGTGHSVDRVGARLAAIDAAAPAVARTLRWYRTRPAPPDSVRAVLAACAAALATPQDRAAWARSAPEGDARELVRHVDAAALVWARARMTAAVVVWDA